MPWRVVEWDGTTETDLMVRAWDGANLTALTIGSEGDPVDPGPGDLFTGDITWPAYAAHRGGDPGPPNTIKAYRDSEGTGTFAEADMRVLADGQTVVLHHDPTIDSTAGASSPIKTGAVSSFSPAQWATITKAVKSWATGDDQPAAFLSDLIDEYGPGSGKYRMLLLEIKRDVPPQVCIDAIIGGGIADRTIVNGYYLSDMQLAASQGLEAMHDTNEPDFPTLVASGINHVGVSEDYVTEAMCTEAASYGIRVWVYLINNTAERDNMLAMGVDGMHTDKPDTVPTTSQDPPEPEPALLPFILPHRLRS